MNARLSLFSFAFLVPLGTLVCVAPADPAGDRMSAVVSGLSHPVEIVGRPPSRMTLDERLHRSGATAVSIAVVRAGRLDWAQGFGVLSEGSEASASSTTLFQAASISKPVTALATLVLAEAGKLDLDTDVNDALTSWKVPENEFTAASPVTIRGILSHSAGFTNGSVGSYAAGEAVPSLTDALRGDAPSTEPPATVEYPPGSRTVYSGGGYSVLQQLLIDVTGTPFGQLMSDSVLAPIGMMDSYFAQPLRSELEHRAAIGHDSSGQPIPGRWETLPEMAAGGLWSTAEDLARMTIALHRAWVTEDGILSPETTRMMMTPVLGSRGLGFETDRVGDRVRYFHTGSNRGYRAIIVGFPETGDAAVILANGDNAGELRYEILRSIARVYDWPGYEIMRKTVVVSDPKTYGEYVGVYDYGGGYTTTILLDDDRLYARLTGGSPVEVFVEGPDRLFSLGGVEYAFTRESGAIHGLTADLGDGSPITARRR